MDKHKAKEYLSSLLNKNLRISTTDGRLFRGLFRCTDPDQNIVLANTYEYRRPSVAEALPAAAECPDGMASRYLGLVVVPGQHVVKMELEEFASQVGAWRSVS
ncbi:hypothetical protein E4U42_001558 [Claviceps africana]|uniref:Sm domain-containing protein n=1 Tax=Claviceps africana TaxID=83212 RepID=A0A8K0JBY5_9HYPO|nr:hypothetical protein E4U42_001558 [Claviceps africana]